VMNGDTEWRGSARWKLARTLLLYPLNHEYALLGSWAPPADALARWDEVLAHRPAAGIVGTDAHGRVAIHRDRALRYPSYAALFGLASNHVLLNRDLTGDAAVDSPALVRALAVGRSYVGLDALAPADGFSFTASLPREAPARPWSMGDVVPPEPGLRLHA